jgi:CubicO group peptidase (beta-lactamase class C family)
MRIKARNISLRNERGKMNIRKLSQFIYFALILSSIPFPASAEDLTNAIAAYLQQYVHAQLPHGCMVIGLVDEHGPMVVSYGDLDNGTDRQADGDTLFNLESATGAFSCLLLQDTVARGEMPPDDPVAKYLPPSVNMPTYHGKQITLHHLAKETSGLRPSILAALDPKRTDHPLEGFTPEKFYALVSSYQLTSAPGTTHLHPSIDRALLSQAMARKAGTDYESLLTARLLAPLHMNDTRFTLTPEMESRVAPEHSRLGFAMPRWHDEDFTPMAALFSTANDVLKFLSACGITSSRLRPLWDNTVANFAFAPQRAGMLHTGGGWFGNGCYIGFDKARHRGVVVLANSYEPRRELGNLLLDSEWQSDRRPTPVSVTSQLCASYAGQYQRSPDFALGLFALRYYVLDRPKVATLLPAGVCLVGLAVLLWRAGNSRKRVLILGWVVLAGVLSVPLLPLASSRIVCACLHPGIGIRSEGGRLFAQPTGANLCSIEDWPNARAWGQHVHPIDVLFPPVPVELLPQSETRFFERLSGVPMTFSRDANDQVTGLTLQYRGKVFQYDRISDAPPKVPEPVKPPIIVKLDTHRLDACVGRYEVAPGAVFPAGMKLTVWREGEQLFAQARGAGEHFIPGAFDLFPESETNFLEKLTCGQFGFTKNDQGQATAVSYHSSTAGKTWFPEWEAKKLPVARGSVIDY